MKEGNITKFKLGPKKPPKSDWRAFDEMSEEHERSELATTADADRFSTVSSERLKGRLLDHFVVFPRGAFPRHIRNLPHRPAAEVL